MKVLMIVGLLILGAVAPALADAVVPYDDGEAHAGNCDVTLPEIHVVDTDDAQGSMQIDCGTSNDTRILKIKLAEKTGTDTYRIFLVREVDVNANNSRHDTITTVPNTSCGPGTGTYVAIITAKKQGGNSDEDRSQEVELPISGCL